MRGFSIGLLLTGTAGLAWCSGHPLHQYADGQFILQTDWIAMIRYAVLTALGLVLYAASRMMPAVRQPPAPAPCAATPGHNWPPTPQDAPAHPHPVP